MSYKVRFGKAADRSFRNLSGSTQRRLASRIDALGVNPRPAGVRKVAGRGARYRLRIGDYRVIYQIEDAVLLVLSLQWGIDEGLPRVILASGGC
ncbi:MAG: hypothetical protein GEU28_12735 [Dehalococcoidia bacterium]|nr:hypothetical protein [Dehalococcoidia bacterium]